MNVRNAPVRACGMPDDVLQDLGGVSGSREIC